MTIHAPPVPEYERAVGAAVWRERAARGLLALRGADAAEFLQGQVTNDVEALPESHGCYALLLNPKGKLLADMRVFRSEPETWLIESSRAALDVVAHTIATHRVGFAFEPSDVGPDFALFSLIGPATDATVGELFPNAAVGPDEHDTTAIAFDGHELVATRTDLGVDLLVSTRGAADALRAALTDRLGQPAGAETVETLRVESGRPLLGRELDGATIPQEADLNERAVNFEKGCYVGQETVARLFYKGKSNRHLRGLLLTAAAGHGDAVTAQDGKALGQIGTAVDSPAHGRIALAILRREAEPGDTVTVGGDPATVVAAGNFPNHRN